MNKKRLVTIIIVLTSLSVICVGFVAFFKPFNKSNNEATNSDNSDKAENEEAFFNNPVKNINYPDPFVYKHTDGYYYGMATTANNILLHRSDKLTNLFTTGESKVIWVPPATGDHSKDLWAPEIHYIDGAWYVYYTAGDGSFDQRTFCISNPNPDPFEGTWKDEGKIYVEGSDYWAIDGTVLKQNGNLYFVFSGWMPHTGGTQHIFIAKMSSPTKITGERIRLSSPDFDWERKVNVNGEPWVNEGPQILQHNGKTFIIYSASFCHSPYYCLGQLTCDSDADPMIPSNWTKSPVPVFESANGIYGPGHCSFTKSPDGTEDWIVYHARTTTNPDEVRKVSMQKFTWNSDGTPNFGKPVTYDTSLELPSGQSESGVIIKSDAVYKLTNMESKLSLGVSDESSKEGALVVLGSGGDSVKWKIIDCYDGTFKLVALHSGQCLDNPAGSMDSGVKIQQWPDNGADPQRWYIIDIGNGYCKIKNKVSGLVLDIADGDEGEGAYIIQAEDKDLPSQKWKVE